MRSLLGLSLSLVLLAACDGDTDAASDASAACTGIAQVSPCPGGACPATFTTLPSAWCFAADAGINRPIQIAIECDGYDIVDYMGVDTASYVIYRASDKQLLGVQSLDANRMTHTCVANVPDTFDASQCRNQFQLIQCGP